MTTSKMLWEAFNCGADYGQLKMEEERDNEDLFDAMLCHSHARRTSMPSNNTPRRMPHSEAWRAAKRDSFKRFQDLIASATREEEK
jgi:hypothetical protein